MAGKKITIFKKVYWKAAGRDMTGKVKMIMADHVVVKGDDGSDYIVRSATLSTKNPTKKS